MEIIRKFVCIYRMWRHWCVASRSPKIQQRTRAQSLYLGLKNGFNGSIYLVSIFVTYGIDQYLNV